jgi:hypothetical protein
LCATAILNLHVEKLTCHSFLFLKSLIQEYLVSLDVLDLLHKLFLHLYRDLDIVLFQLFNNSGCLVFTRGTDLIIRRVTVYFLRLGVASFLIATNFKADEIFEGNQGVCLTIQTRLDKGGLHLFAQIYQLSLESILEYFQGCLYHNYN